MAKTSEEPDLFISFSLRSFLRSFSYRDVLTSVALSLLLRALIDVLHYYAYEEFFENRIDTIIRVLFCLFLCLNHIVYKSEHRRPNNFIGRVALDLIFIISYFVVMFIQNYLQGNVVTYESTVGGVIAIILAVFVLLVIFEICLAILKRLLNLLKWRLF